MQIDSYLSPCTRLKFKCFKDLKIKLDTLNIEDKVENSLESIGTGFLLSRTSVAQALRSTIDKLELIKLKSFCQAKDIVNRTKW